MTDDLEHQECAESLGAFVLGALPETESVRVQRHISDCRECRAEFEWLRVSADALPASVTPVEPPPELKARVMAIVEAEAELLRAAGAAADRPPQERRDARWRWGRGGNWFSMAALGAAATAAVAASAVVLLTSGGNGTRTIRAQVSASVAPAVASLTVRGTKAELQVARLPAPAPNHVDEVWVKRGSGAPEPAGTFVLSSGQVQLHRPVQSGDLVMVTVESGRGTPAPTGAPILVIHA